MYKTAVLAASAPNMLVHVLDMGAEGAEERVMYVDTTVVTDAAASRSDVVVGSAASVDVMVSAQTCAEMVSGGKLVLSSSPQSNMSLVKFVAREIDGNGQNGQNQKQKPKKQKWTDMLSKAVRDEISIITKGVHALTGRTLCAVPMVQFMAKIGQCREAHFEEPTQSGFDVVAHEAERHTAIMSMAIRAAIEDVCKPTTKYLTNDDAGAWVFKPWVNIDVEVIGYNRTQAARGRASAASVRVPLRRMPAPEDPDAAMSDRALSPQPRVIIKATATAKSAKKRPASKASKAKRPAAKRPKASLRDPAEESEESAEEDEAEPALCSDDDE
jgi:hypothetical protein